MVHKFAVNALRPTPDKTHYLFNLRDFSRVILGVLLSTPESMEDLRAMKRLWVHEAMRTYYDRLVDNEDKSSLYTKIQDVTKECMKEDFSSLFAKLKDNGSVTEDKIRALHFCDFLDPNEDEKFYRENTNMDLLRESATSYLDEYNKTSRKPMDLVLFHFALEHLCKISRVLKQPQSNAVLIGVGGSGRQSLTRLAAHISNHSFQMFEMTYTYSFKEWRVDIKNVLRKFSLELSHCVLFLYGSQLKDPSCYEDINNILNLGEVPCIFNFEEKNEIIENMKALEPQLDKSLHTEGGAQELFNLFIR
jgi:dynein heavy chain